MSPAPAASSAAATATAPEASPAAAAAVRQWSVPVRLMHWTLAACVIGCLGLHGQGRAHHVLGYAALGVAALRVALGFVGPAPMRWRRFVRGPSQVLDHARRMLRGTEPRHLDHNPLGGWMVLALLAGALAAGASGALFVTDAFWGVEWVEELHEAAGDAFWLLVPLHVAGVLLASWRHRENLVASMLHGRKRAPRPGDGG